MAADSPYSYESSVRVISRYLGALLYGSVALNCLNALSAHVTVNLPIRVIVGGMENLICNTWSIPWRNLWL